MQSARLGSISTHYSVQRTKGLSMMAKRKTSKNRKQVKRQTRHFQLRAEHPIDQHVKEILDFKRSKRSEVTAIRDGVRLLWALGLLEIQNLLYMLVNWMLNT
jgi:Flp pilus assembly protein TadB